MKRHEGRTTRACISGVDEVKGDEPSQQRSLDDARGMSRPQTAGQSPFKEGFQNGPVLVHIEHDDARARALGFDRPTS